MKQLSTLMKNSNNPDNNWFSYFVHLLNEGYRQVNNLQGGISGFVVEKTLDYANKKRNEIQDKIYENKEKFKNLGRGKRNEEMARNMVCGYSIDECSYSKNNERLSCQRQQGSLKSTSTVYIPNLKCDTDNKKQSICACFNDKEEDKIKKNDLIAEGDKLQKTYDTVNKICIHGKQIAKCSAALYGVFKGHKEYIKMLENTPINSKMDNYQDFFVVALNNKPLPLIRVANNGSDNEYADFDTINNTLQPCLFFGTDHNTITIRGINDNASQLKKILKLDPNTDPVFVNDNNLKLLIYTSILPTISPEENPEFYNLIANRIEETRRVAENRIVRYRPNLQLQAIRELNDRKNNCNIF